MEKIMQSMKERKPYGQKEQRFTFSWYMKSITSFEINLK